MKMKPIRCTDCGRFVSFKDENAKVYYEPESDRGSEITEWTCGKCVAEIEGRKNADHVGTI